MVLSEHGRQAVVYCSKPARNTFPVEIGAAQYVQCGNEKWAWVDGSTLIPACDGEGL